MPANRQVFASHIDPSIASERIRAFDAQPWAFSYQRVTGWRGVVRAFFDYEMNAAYWTSAIAAAERIPEAIPVKETVPAGVFDRLDASRSSAGPQQVAQHGE